VGRALLEELVARSEAEGIWTLQTSIFPENRASLALHLRCGFRVVGLRERIAQLDGVWRDTVLLERRAGSVPSPIPHPPWGTEFEGTAGRRAALCRFGAESRADRPGTAARVIKVEAIVLRERVETVIDAVEEATGHVGVTVVEAVGHGRERGITHEYRGRVFESRFLPKAVLTFVVADALAPGVVAAVADAARSGNESGDGLVWTSPVGNVTHHRTGKRLEEVER
jgi:nitrogen regulatory protein PII